LTNIRRSRGYAWEVGVIEIFDKLRFVVSRLGGTTITMPDVSAHKDDSKLIIGIECKSTVGNVCVVPGEQIQRCIDWCNSWGLYENKMVILAFKFGNKGTGKQREEKTYLKIWNFKNHVSEFICHYDGDCTIKDGLKRIEINLEEFVELVKRR